MIRHEVARFVQGRERRGEWCAPSPLASTFPDRRLTTSFPPVRSSSSSGPSSSYTFLLRNAACSRLFCGLGTLCLLPRSSQLRGRAPSCRVDRMLIDEKEEATLNAVYDRLKATFSESLLRRMVRAWQAAVDMIPIEDAARAS